jgi:AmmeMemoRadiSam system protein A
MPPLSSDDQGSLLALARRVVLEFVLHHRLADVPVFAGRLAEPGSAFVTLHCFSKLRGCIGRTDGALSLGETVAQCAISAAAHDPRFAPVANEDLPGLAIEISVLSEFQPLSPEAIAKPASPQAISKPTSPLSPQTIVAGTQGLLVVRGDHRGLLLPQVAI